MSSTGLLRTSRKYHRWIGSAFFVFFFVISITGFLLGWKNLFNTTLYAGKKIGHTKNMSARWLPLDTLETIARHGLVEKAAVIDGGKIDRLDIRVRRHTVSE